jgi:hypothetical protein
MQEKFMLREDQMRDLEDLTNRKEKELVDLRKSSGRCEHLIKKY